MLYIDNTDIVSPRIGDWYFDKVNASGDVDESMFAAARYLLFEKLKDGETLTISTDVLPCTTFEDSLKLTRESCIANYKNKINSIKILCVDGSFSVDTVKSVAGFTSNKTVDKYISQFFPTKVFTSIQYKASIVVLRRSDYYQICRLQVVLPHLAKWLYPKENNKLQLPELDRKFITLLNHNSEEAKTECTNMIRDLVSKYHTRENMINRICKDIGKEIYDAQIQQEKNRLEALKLNIKSHMITIASTRTDIARSEERIYGLQYRAGSFDEKIYRDLFIALDFVELVSVENGTIRFIARTTSNINEEDIEMVQSLLQQEETDLVYELRNRGIYKEDFMLLMKNIFSDDPDFEIKTLSTIQLNIGAIGNSILTSFDSYMQSEGYVGHPHIQYYGCFGTGWEATTQFLLQGDIISAIQQAAECAHNLNPKETNIFFDFICRVFESKEKILLSKDGESVTPSEAVESLRK